MEKSKNKNEKTNQTNSNNESDVKRQQFIPINKMDVIDLLCSSGRLDSKQQSKFKDFCKILEHIYHKEFYEKTNELKKYYYPLNPDLDIVKLKNLSEEQIDKNSKNFIEKLEEVLINGNYDKVTDKELEYALDEKSIFKVNLIVDFDEFKEFLLYRRGESTQEIEISSLFGLIKKKMNIQVFDRVVLYIRFKDDDYFVDKSLGKIKLPQKNKFIGALTSFGRLFKTKKREKILKKLTTEPGSTALKLFKNIPKADIEMLFPNTRVWMTPKDMITIGIPALIGTVSAFVTKFLASIVIVITIVGLFFSGGSLDEGTEIKRAVSGLAAIGAFGAYIARQFGKYKNKKINFMKKLSENLYFRNLDNNQGVFTYLIDSAEEQEFKEAVLSYYFLLIEKDMLTDEELDGKVEEWITEKINMDVDFEISDALRKINELGLTIKETKEDGKEKYTVVSIDESLEKMDYLWDNYFNYNN